MAAKIIAKENRTVFVGQNTHGQALGRSNHFCFYDTIELYADVGKQ